jgi:hypothetical protein
MGSSTTTTQPTGTTTQPTGPQLTRVDPSRGNPYGGTSVALYGSGFAVGSAVRFGPAAATSIQVVSESVILCITPANPAGLVDVEVELPSGQRLRLNNAFDYDPNAGPFGRVADIGDPTGAEHELLELVNRARRDPPAEGLRLGVDFSGIAARPPLTHDALLAKAALGHSLDMAQRAFYGHSNPDGVGPVGRVLDALYALHSRYGTNRAANTIENIAAASGNLLDSPQKVHDTFLLDAGLTPPKHRELLLGIGNFRGRRQAGFGYRTGLASTGPYNTFVSEEVAATQRDLPLVLGSVFDDASGDGIARDGEGQGNVVVTLTHPSGFALQTTTSSAGAFAFEVYASGPWTLSIGGSSKAITLGADNVKVDRVSGAVRTY